LRDELLAWLAAQPGEERASASRVTRLAASDPSEDQPALAEEFVNGR
jgi:hypothetical protein